MKMSNSFEQLVEGMKSEHPELWEQAQKDVKEYFNKVRSGEIKLNIKELYFDENGDLREGFSVSREV